MIKNSIASAPIIKVSPPRRSDTWTIRILICCAIVCMTLFVLWFFKPGHMGYGPIYFLLTFALLFKLLKMLHEWYHYWSPAVPVPPLSKTTFTVDVFTTACPGEPHEMIIRTLKAMKAIRYAHTNYLCDEGDDPLLKKVCLELGVVHVTRTEKTGAKAGNINNALKQASGEICVILDPDHEPVPEFLDRVLPYFEDPEIGYVQCVQAYGNQSESIIARGAAEQSYHFYGPMMMCMNSYGTVQAIGANCTFRRKALDSIGGHAAGLAEDMHTAMQLQAKGWKPLYIPEILTRGLVPATLGAYYKQQLKWSRGCFELLFRTYPSLFKNFTWRQKIHHFTMPLYFLFGLVNFIDILIPILSLGLARVPWEINIAHFAWCFLPLCALSMIIRLFAQRWLLEKRERGFHLAGGILRTATWWIFLVGFIYAIFNINVPYIPTPKGDEHRNHWRLSIPNLLVTLLCATAIVYGLAIDWSPYSIAMAIYAAINAAALLFIVIISQQQWLMAIRKKTSVLPAVNYALVPLRFSALKIQQAFYKTFSSGPIILIFAVTLLLLSYSSGKDETHPEIIKEKEAGGFYCGIFLPENENDLKSLEGIERSVRTSFDVVSITESWGNDFPDTLLKEIDRHGSIPMINWGPGPVSNGLCSAICEGSYDHYLQGIAAHLRKYGEPVFLSFAPGFDGADSSRSARENNPAPEFRKAWQYMYTFFNDLGISNITWVWSPRYPTAVNYYPGPKFVDWVGISCLNYEENPASKNWYSFSQLYLPYRHTFGSFQKPVMITEFGSSAGPGQGRWVNEALQVIQKDFMEIRSVVLYNALKKIPVGTGPGAYTYCSDFSCKEQSVLSSLENNFREEPFVKRPFLKNYKVLNVPSHFAYQTGFIKGGPGKFQLVVKGKPWYIRGVAYNTAHDWRDGDMPLTRRQLEKDFENIKNMGANTIRRYSYNIYDKNVLNVAEEYDLKVMYGFWFDPKIDYYRDTEKVKEYIHEVEQKVQEYKGYPALLAWSLGNETWGLLKHSYSKPYLTRVRQQYVKLVELLAQRIHELDPDHPVLTCMEHEIYQLPGEVVAFHDGAPSVDVIGINSYYKEQISLVNKVSYHFDSLRPYLVSEFGPRGYWDAHYNRVEKEQLVEDNESEKAAWYREQWSNYVSAFEGFNIGGFAYCWHDRMEGSYTWFGLTDYKGRLKPGYYALKELWTKQKAICLPSFSIQAPQRMVPGKEYTFTALSSSGKYAGLNYEWQLLKNDDFEPLDDNINKRTEHVVTVQIPEDASGYRLYLYVSDDQGNVTTSSVPLSQVNDALSVVR